MKKIVSILLVVFVVLSVCFLVSAETVSKISELTDSEVVELIKEYGVEIPGEADKEMEWVPFIRFIVEEVEKNPSCVFTFGSAELTCFAHNIQNAVWEYYGVEGVSGSPRGPINVMEDNTLACDWNDNFANYNCYAYAIGYSSIRISNHKN